MTDWFELVDRECSDIKEYLAQHADFDIDTENQLGQTLLYLKTKLSDIESVTFLLKKGANPNKYDCTRMTPLLLALSLSQGEQNEWYNIAFAIIEHSMTLNFHHQGYLSGTALSYALYLGFDEVSNKLIQKEIETQSQFLPEKHPHLLFCAVRSEKLDLIKLILQKTNDGETFRDGDWIDHPDWIWRHALECEDNGEFYPLDYKTYDSAATQLIYEVIENGDKDMLDALLNSKLPNFISGKDKRHRDIFEHACQLANKNEAMLQLLNTKNSVVDNQTAHNLKSLGLFSCDSYYCIKGHSTSNSILGNTGVY